MVFVLYPQESGDIKVDVQSAAGTAWASGAITAASVADDVSTEIRDKIVLRTTLRGTVSTSSSTTSVTTSAMSPATSAADQLKGRIVIFDHDTTTAALRGAATDITASSASASGHEETSGRWAAAVIARAAIHSAPRTVADRASSCPVRLDVPGAACMCIIFARPAGRHRLPG